MNMSLFNICCCCLKEGSYKNLFTEYYQCDQKEIYSEMLKETFNIWLFSDKNQESLKTQLICEACVTQLRDSTKFKQMVLNNYRIYLQYLNKYQSDENGIKTEKIEDTDIPFCEPDSNSYDEDDEILANIKLELSKDNLVKNNSVLPVSRLKRVKIKKIQKSNVTQHRKDWTKLVERRGSGPILRETSLKILSNSTACVFQWNKSRYRCFCCDKPYSDLNLLREHSNTKHTLEDIKKKIITQQNRLVKVEISVLNCKICQNQFDNLAALKEHLTVQHDLTFDSEEDLLVPFKIKPELKCQLCNEQFRVFRHLNIHMNRHYQKHVCYICGAGFSNLVFLNLHKTRTHKPFSCKLCNLIFVNKTEKKQHDSTVHDVKHERKLRFPCPYCEERFLQENLKIKHLVERHGMEQPEHKCNICSKTFLTRSLRNNHVKNVHMKEKKHECDVCHHFFYTKSDVTRHRVTHTGEKKYSCSYCNNPFATKDSLRRHVKRAHS